MSSKDSTYFSSLDQIGRPLKGSSSGSQQVQEGASHSPASGFMFSQHGKDFGSDRRMDTLQDSSGTRTGSVGSVKSAGSHMSHGSRSSLHSHSSTWSQDSRGSLGSLQGADVMGSAQYVALSEELLKQQLAKAQMAAAGRPPFGNPFPPSASHLTIAPGHSCDQPGQLKSDFAPPTDLLMQQQALQKSHAKQQQDLYANQLYEQLSMLSPEYKQAILSSLQKSAPAALGGQSPSSSVPSSNKPKSESDLHKGKSSDPATRLPMFLTSSSSSLSRMDKDHLEQLCKTFGDGFAQNILPMPILIPSVTNPWEYKTYLVSLEDVCNVDEYMEDQGRSECGNVNIGQVLVEAIGKTKASLKSKGKGKRRTGDSKQDKKSTETVLPKPTFVSTQSLSVAETKIKEKSEADIFGRDLASQMGVGKPTYGAGSGLGRASCWEGTTAAPDMQGAMVNTPTDLPQASQVDTSALGTGTIWSTGDSSAAAMLYGKKMDTDVTELVESLCAGKKKKCVIS